VIKFTSCLPRVGGSLRVLRLPPPLKLVAMILLKVALNTKIQIQIRWFSPGTPVSSTNKTDRHNIIKILLKVALNTITPSLYGDLSRQVAYNVYTKSPVYSLKIYCNFDGKKMSTLLLS
jgi:hypothetical protein